MTKLGGLQIPPTVFVTYVDHKQEKQVASIQLDEPIPFRTLSYPRTRNDAMFYANETVPISTQEAILRASAYPQVNKTPDNFWGQRPPL